MRHHTGIQFPGNKRTVTTSDGVSLSVREYGPRDAAHTVVLLHGFCLNKDSWTIQIEHLLHQYGDSIRIISYDHRGHGDSASAPMHTYHIDQLATDLRALASLTTPDASSILIKPFDPSSLKDIVRGLEEANLQLGLPDL